MSDADGYFIKSLIRLATYVDLMAPTNSCVEVVGIQEVSQQSFGSAEKETISTLEKNNLTVIDRNQPVDLLLRI